VQRRLTGLGFDTKVNGTFDDPTRAVIKRWQAARGYPSTGFLNKLQHKALQGEIVATVEAGASDDLDDHPSRHHSGGGGRRHYYHGSGGGGGRPGGLFGGMMGDYSDTGRRFPHVEVTNHEEPMGWLLALQVESGKSFVRKRSGIAAATARDPELRWFKAGNPVQGRETARESKTVSSLGGIGSPKVP
jgi:Putative peptidoglycan binding domain